MNRNISRLALLFQSDDQVTFHMALLIIGRKLFSRYFHLLKSFMFFCFYSQLSTMNSLKYISPSIAVLHNTLPDTHRTPCYHPPYTSSMFRPGHDGLIAAM